MTDLEKLRKATDLLWRYVDRTHDEMNELEEDGEFTPANADELPFKEYEEAISAARKAYDELTYEAFAFLTDEFPIRDWRPRESVDAAAP